jgi:polar amino acid transport system substrate-binding protein
MLSSGPFAALANRRRLLQQGGVLSAAAAAAVGLTAPVRAQSEGESLLNRVLDRGNIIVGTGSTNPPWHFEDENGDLVGMDIEMGRILAQALFEDTSKVQFMTQAADARIPNLLSDKTDIVIQFMSETRDRAQLVNFTMPYYREAVMSQFDSNANTILELDAGRVDAALADFSTAQWFSAQSPEKYKYPTDTWGTHSYVAAVKPGDQRWLNFVNSIFHVAITGLDFEMYKTAFEKYFGQEIELPPPGYPTELS